MKEQLAKIRAEALSAMENAQSAAELDGTPSPPPSWTGSGCSTWARRASSPPF